MSCTVGMHTDLCERKPWPPSSHVRPLSGRSPQLSRYPDAREGRVSEMAENNTADRRDDATPKRKLIKREVAVVKEKFGEALRRLANS